jgi:hypothetical protein
MPGGDRTGPMGRGPRTGRGLGDCARDEPLRGPDRKGYPGPGQGRGRGRGWGFGRGLGRGLGRGFRGRWRQEEAEAPVRPEPPRDDEDR